MFGLWMPFDGALGWRSVAVVATVGVVMAAAAIAVAQTLRRRRTVAANLRRTTANRLS